MLEMKSLTKISWLQLLLIGTELFEDGAWIFREIKYSDFSDVRVWEKRVSYILSRNCLLVLFIGKLSFLLKFWQLLLIGTNCNFGFCVYMVF